MSGEPFSKKFLKEQKALLLELKEQIINSLREDRSEDLHVNSDDIMEDGDLAQVTLNQALAIGLKEKDLHKLREIDQAIARIENGSYGICEETDEPISEARLKKIPWTRYSIQAAEELERQSGQRRVG